jgi:uncharacterized protein
LNLARLTRSITISAAVIAAVYVAACGYMWATQRDHVFEPEMLLQTTPDRLGMKFEELYIPVGSGADKGQLHAWWIPSDQTGAPTMFYLHGNFRNISNNLEQSLRLHNLGFNVLLMDYRGYGKSSGGSPSEAKVYEDAETAWQYMLKQRGVKLHQAFIYGHSLGGAIAIDLAVHHPEAAGLIIEGTFTSMSEMGKLIYPLLPVDWLLDQRFEALDKITRIGIPLLVIHGTWDRKVPVMMAKQLYAAAPKPKMLALIEGGEHNNTGAVGWTEYRDAVSAFVKHALINQSSK